MSGDALSPPDSTSTRMGGTHVKNDVNTSDTNHEQSAGSAPATSEKMNEPETVAAAQVAMTTKAEVFEEAIFFRAHHVTPAVKACVQLFVKKLTTLITSSFARDAHYADAIMMLSETTSVPIALCQSIINFLDGAAVHHGILAEKLIDHFSGDRDHHRRPQSPTPPAQPNPTKPSNTSAATRAMVKPAYNIIRGFEAYLSVKGTELNHGKVPTTRVQGDCPWCLARGITVFVDWGKADTIKPDNVTSIYKHNPWKCYGYPKWCDALITDHPELSKADICYTITDPNESARAAGAGN